MTVNDGFWRGRSVFLTGHTGFKGAWLSLWLRRLGAEVHGYALAPTGEPNLYDRIGGDGVVTSSTLADVADFKALEAALVSARPSVVIHMAAQALVRPSYGDPFGTFRTNVLGTVHLLEVVRSVGGVLATIVVTSDKCYENREQIWSYREGDPLGGRDPYSGSKAAAEIATSSYGRSFFGSQRGETKLGALATARAGNVIGGGDWSPDRLVPDIVRALEYDSIADIRRPDAVRPWQHVLEPLRGYLKLAEHLVADPGQSFDSWNFGPNSDAEQSVIVVAQGLCEAWGRIDALRIAQDDGPHEASFLTVDNTKARRVLGWRPRLTLAEALTWTADWYRLHMRGDDASELCLAQIDSYTAKIGE